MKKYSGRRLRLINLMIILCGLNLFAQNETRTLEVGKPIEREIGAAFILQGEPK